MSNSIVMVLSESGLKRNNGRIVNDTFYCPILGCKYNLHFGQSMKSFKTQKLLKQHCIKVHSDKKYKCDNCEKGFPLESTLKSHRIKCGVIYSCYCGIQYKSPEAFLTHTKRKQHNIGLGYSTIMKFLKTRKLLPNTEDLQELESSKRSTQTQTVADVQTLSDSSTQTTFENKDCMLRYNDPKLSSATSSPIRRLCAQTQTDPMGDFIKIESDPMFLDSETQTNFDFLDIYTQTAESECLFGDLEFTNIQTQTYCSSLFNDDSVDMKNEISLNTNMI
ncbi:uncharacterized protein LOC100161403 [Acyrthosiphon pisum]|uniref:C2H2-type domain-containing protein n=1 Tax=Acyrthosiphon pisum TaxID=7029 RepID=A0A8R1VZU1_ACYPI|nr:uncharacterized protein LOC100161403 [Acyrthosiphon pisum]XP_008186641.1 uncharacterized protein LOC100161403 [Acyrthosiphon pisum]|eukprot:XP_001945743.2 PREDICTED: uncharacterized protein LOC100161403 [Acyrthosiphon pisum]